MAGGDGKKGEPAPTEYKFAQKPEVREGWDGFAHFVWNSETSEFLGRTGMSWLKIGIFYVIYYAFLAGFFIVMLLIFYQTLEEYRPKWRVENGIIGGNPGVGFRPRPEEAHIESTLIWFRSGDANGNWGDWVERYNKTFLKDYYEDQDNVEFIDKQTSVKTKKVDCEVAPPGTNQLCKVNRDKLFQGDCTYENNYGFKEGKPCIIIKLNKIYDWEPLEYDHEYNKPPSDFPKELNGTFWANVEKQKELDKDDGNKDKEPLNDRVWIECHGQNPADVENMGPVVYYPEMGVSKRFYPYKNQDKYLSPVVFMQMQKPRQGVMIAIECKAWAKNIEHNSQERRGLAHFEVMID